MRKFKRKSRTCVIIIGFSCISFISSLISENSKSPNTLDDSILRKNVYERTEKDSLFKKYIMDDKYTKQQRILSYEKLAEFKRIT